MLIRYDFSMVGYLILHCFLTFKNLQILLNYRILLNLTLTVVLQDGSFHFLSVPVPIWKKKSKSKQLSKNEYKSKNPSSVEPKLIQNLQISRNDLLFHGQSDGVKIKFSLECVRLVVLISSSIGESSWSKSNRNSEDYAFLYTFPCTGYLK